VIVFFDLDDTLIDSQRAVGEAISQIHRDLQIMQPLEEFRAAWRAAHARWYPRYLDGHLGYDDLRRVRVRDALGADLKDHEADAVFEKYMNAYESNWALFADVQPCLNALQGLRLGVISNGPSREQRRLRSSASSRPSSKSWFRRSAGWQGRTQVSSPERASSRRSPPMKPGMSAIISRSITAG
jgi:FMN phosphatase YigB (HAD superfamily)